MGEMGGSWVQTRVGLIAVRLPAKEWRQKSEQSSCLGQVPWKDGVQL